MPASSITSTVARAGDKIHAPKPTRSIGWCSVSLHDSESSAGGLVPTGRARCCPWDLFGPYMDYGRARTSSLAWKTAALIVDGRHSAKVHPPLATNMRRQREASEMNEHQPTQPQPIVPDPFPASPGPDSPTDPHEPDGPSEPIPPVPEPSSPTHPDPFFPEAPPVI